MEVSHLLNNMLILGNICLSIPRYGQVLLSYAKIWQSYAKIWESYVEIWESYALLY